MFKYSYISSSLKPSAISEAITAKFVRPDVLNLILSKAEWLEIYSISPTFLDLCFEIPLNSQIACISRLSLNSEKDAILILTESKHLLTIEYSNHPIVLSETLIPTQQTGKIERDFKIALSDCQKVCLTYTEKDYLSLTFMHDCKITESNLIASRGDSLRDMKFLQNNLNVAMIYEVKKDEYRLKIYQVIVNEKRLEEKRCLSLEHRPQKLISGQNNTCFIFCTENIIKYSATFNTFSPFACDIKVTSAVCQVNNDNLLVSDDTYLYLVNITNEFSVQVLGKACITSDLCQISADTFFLSSKMNYSKFFRVLPELLEDSYIENIHTINNIAPLIDFKISEEVNLRVLDLIACSGCEETGGFRLISKGVTVNIELEQEIPNIQGIWTVSFSPPYDSLMFMSFGSMTKIFKIVDFSITSFIVPGKNNFSQPSLLIFQKDSYLVQVSTEGLYIYSKDFELLKEFNLFNLGSSITYSSYHGEFLAISLKDQTIIVLNLNLPEITECSRVNLENDISCLYIFCDTLIFGFWEVNNLVVYNIKTMNEVYKEQQGFSAAVRSVKIVQLKTKTKLIVGLRDGCLIFYQIKDGIQFFKESSLKIGYQGVLIDTMQAHNSVYVFIACDRPVVLHFENDQFHMTNISLKEVTFFSSFHTESFPHCIALSIKNKFLIVSLPQLQEYSFENYIKKYTIRKLALYEDKIIALAFLDKIRPIVGLYDSEKNEVDVYLLNSNEVPNCIVSEKKQIFVGISIYNQADNTQVGKLLAFSVNNNKLVLKYFIDFQGPVLSFSVQDNYLFVGADKEISCYRINENSLQLLDNSQKICYPIVLEAQNNIIAAAGVFKSISLYSFSNEKLLLTHRNYHISYTSSLKIISSDILIASEASGYIYIMQTNNRNNLLDIISLFYIGTEVINTIKLNTYPARHGKETNLIFVTSKGRIGVIFNLDEEKYKILKALEGLIVNEGGRSCFFDKKMIKDEVRLRNVPVFVQGDVVEIFMEFSPEKKVFFALNVGAEVGKIVEVNEILDILLEMIKIP